jgi:hypothetical protein
LSRLRRVGIGLTAAVVGVLAAPGLAGACTLPGVTDVGFSLSRDATGTVTAAQQGSYLQIPFGVPPGTTAIRIRYCYDASPSGTTLDMGVYEPLHQGDTIPGPPERRGWSGSAVKDLAISENGFSPANVYESARKAYVHGYTTRAYQPGPLPPGTWTAELGIAALGGPSAGFEVKVETSSSTDWSDHPYTKVAQSSAPASPNPGWYVGDVHAHGEQEPGNALVKTSLDYAFKPISQGGAGLDWIGLVDHNNDISRGEIGKYEPSYPGKLIIPGTEVTTYHGHYNSIGSSAFPDFRGGPVLVYPWMNQIAPTTLPASQLGALQAGGGWTQVNHPTIFPSDIPINVRFCRGCPWDWTPAQTDYSKVDAIEVQTGPADIGATQNPFTPPAIALYEARLAAGDHIAAVASSDSHQADQTDVTTAPIGRGATVVYATELSKAAIVDGIRHDHTYAKPYGSDGPDIRLTARSPGADDAILGDTISGPSLTLEVEVLRAGPGAVRPGTYDVQLLRDGVVVEQATVTGDDFETSFDQEQPGRYSIQVIREDPAANRIEIYSSPVWYERAENLKLGKLRLDRRHGTGKLTVTVGGPGELTLKGNGVKTVRKTAHEQGKLKLKVKPKGKLAERLRETGTAKVKARVKLVPEEGLAAKDSKKLKLKRSG